jgi:hypothetical protein
MHQVHRSLLVVVHLCMYTNVWCGLGGALQKYPQKPTDLWLHPVLHEGTRQLIRVCQGRTPSHKRPTKAHWLTIVSMPRAERSWLPGELLLGILRAMLQVSLPTP